MLRFFTEICEFVFFRNSYVQMCNTNMSLIHSVYNGVSSVPSATVVCRTVVMHKAEIGSRSGVASG